MSEPWMSLEEEALSVLFRIVRTNMQGHALGHDVMIAARSVVRRAYPDAYKDLQRRYEKKETEAAS